MLFFGGGGGEGVCLFDNGNMKGKKLRENHNSEKRCIFDPFNVIMPCLLSIQN